MANESDPVTSRTFARAMRQLGVRFPRQMGTVRRHGKSIRAITSVKRQKGK